MIKRIFEEEKKGKCLKYIKLARAAMLRVRLYFAHNNRRLGKIMISTTKISKKHGGKLIYQALQGKVVTVWLH